MTRKKYDKDIYDEEYDSTSSDSEDEEIPLTDEEKFNIVEYYWDPWKDTHLADWVDPTDIYKFLYSIPKVSSYQYDHLITDYEQDLPDSIRKTVHKMCKDLKILPTRQKVSQVVYSILKKRNDFCAIHRDDYHWTHSWCKKIRSF